MRYSGYGRQEFPGPLERRERARVPSHGPGASTGNRFEGPERGPGLPRGVTDDEAAFFLGMIARLKEKRFGRVAVTVREGHVINAEFVEKVDRTLFQSFGG